VGSSIVGELTTALCTPLPDDSFHIETLVGATGAVIRDENGVSLKAMARRIPAACSVLMAEEEAWRDGLRLLGPEPEGKVILE
jgi:hypothetical protein